MASAKARGLKEEEHRVFPGQASSPAELCPEGSWKVLGAKATPVARGSLGKMLHLARRVWFPS